MTDKEQREQVSLRIAVILWDFKNNGKMFESAQPWVDRILRIIPKEEK